MSQNLRGNDPEKHDNGSIVTNAKDGNQSLLPVNATQEKSYTKEVQKDVNSSEEEKTAKKPDKILPCPRCNSFDTKFCYFNNYNVNQPRHFCKNCQRYWTAGGTMRNVPVGAGRRKNKHLATQFRQILVSSDAMTGTGMEAPSSLNQQILPSVGNSTVLKFGTEAPLCKSVETVLNLGNPSRHSNAEAVSCRENGEEQTSPGLSIAPPGISGHNVTECSVPNQHNDTEGSQKQQNQMPPMRYYAVPSWFVPWNSGWNNRASIPVAQKSAENVYVPYSNNPNNVHWYPTVPGVCPPNVPLQLVSASYPGCTPLWSPGAGNVSLTGSSGCLSPSSSTSNSCCSSNGSPTLGKHSRDTNFLEEEKMEKLVLVPKTLRIDPHEASKSPAPVSLGIKPDQNKVPIPKSTDLGALHPETDGKSNEADAA